MKTKLLYILSNILVIIMISMVQNAGAQEICNNGIDDDGDGLIDLNDVVDCNCPSTVVPSLIPNASFEAMNCCPSSYSQVNCATSWIQASSATSDYMNTCGIVFGAATSAGLVPFPDGNGILGAIFAPGWQEYVGACLTSPLLAGTAYTLNMNIASTPIDDQGNVCNGGVINYSPIDLTIYGNTTCTSLPFAGTACPPAPWQVIGVATYTPVSSWGIISISFTPAANINAIVIGSPCVLPPDYTYGPCYPYFYFDNLILNQSSLFSSITPTGSWCNNDIVLTGSNVVGATYQWYLNNIALVGETGIALSVSANSYGAGTYTLITTLGGSCTTASYDVVAQGAPVPSIISVTNVSCNGGNDGAITFGATGGVAPYTYDIGGGGQTSGTFGTLTAGNYTVTVTDANNCSATIMATVTEPPLLTASVTALNDVTCFGGADGGVTITAVGGVPTYTYNIGAGPVAGNVFTGLLFGSYNILVTDFNGCTFNVPFTISEPPLLTAAYTTVNVLCNGGNDGQIVTTAAGGTTPYFFDIGAGPVSSGTFTPLIAGTYTVIVTDFNSCSTTLTPIVITEPTAIALTTTSNPSNCGLADGSVAVAPTGGTVVVDYSYLWQDAALTTVATTAIGNNLFAGTYTVTVTDDNGCTATATATITDNASGVPTTVNDANVTCNGYCDGQATVTMTGGTIPFSYQWSSGSTPTAATTAGLCAGTAVIQVTDNVGCVVTDSVVITEPTLLTATTTIVDETCIGDCTGSISITPSGGTSSYQYSFDNGVTFGVVNSLGSLCAGTYNLVVQDNNACKTFFTVDVLQGAPYADATITPIGPFCVDAPSAGLSAATGGGTWSGNGVSGSVFTPSVAGAGTTTVTYMISSACGDTATYDVLVNPLPVINFSGDVLSGCEPLDVVFTNTGTAGPDCYWNFGDGVTSTDCGPVSHTYPNPGYYDVTLTVTDANSCTNTGSVSNYIQVFANPVADFSFSPQPTTIFNPTIYFTDQSTNATGWSWDFSGLGSSGAQNPSFNFDDVGTFTVNLIVTSPEGCLDSINYDVIINNEFVIYVPNTFTPDGDGFNDYFFPVINGYDPESFKMYIFDRWGELIFETQLPSIYWDGTYKGNPVQEDVYVWKIDIKSEIGKRYEYYGHVTVLK